jgi:hypothetical protein
MRRTKIVMNGLIGATAVLFASSQLVSTPQATGPVLTSAVEFVSGDVADTTTVDSTADASSTASMRTAMAAFASRVRQLSHPQALESAFKSYYTYKSEHPEKVTKPYLYFVDYGLPSTTARGYVFDMESLKIVDGPFTVAHGRGSSKSRFGIPTRFSNAVGSAATSLGLYRAQETYSFSGKAGGRRYRSIGLRMMGLSGDFNDNARARGVVAHGAPYVTAKGSGRSEGCPAMEEWRARKLLPKLANGGMVFLFAPKTEWMKSDPWLS